MRLPEDSLHGRFATKKIRHTTGKNTNVTKNLSVTVGQTFATVPMRKIRHTTMIGWGWVGRVRGVEVEGVGVGENKEPPNPDPRPQPPDPNSINPKPPDFNPPTSTPLTPTPPTLPTQPLTPIYHRCVANLPHRHCCKRLSDSYAQILRHIRILTRCVANLLCGESSVANLPCGESSGNLFCQQYLKQ